MEENYESDVSGGKNTTITGKENSLKQHFDKYYGKVVNTLKGTFNVISYTISSGSKTQKELDTMKKDIQELRQKQSESEKTIYELNETIHQLEKQKRNLFLEHIHVFAIALLLIAAFILFKILK